MTRATYRFVDARLFVRRGLRLTDTRAATRGVRRNADDVPSASIFVSSSSQAVTTSHASDRPVVGESEERPSRAASASICFAALEAATRRTDSLFSLSTLSWNATAARSNTFTQSGDTM